MSEIAAFFDMDETLIGVNSVTLWLRHLWKRGDLSTRELARSMGYLLGYKLAVVDVNRIADVAVSRLAGQAEAEMRADVHAWYEREVRPHILRRMVEVVESHREAGHRLVLLTASSPYVAGPMAEELQLDDFLCTRFEVEGGRFTGRLDGPMCYGPGKVTHSRAWAERENVRLEEAHFYSDSYTDLPMFEIVGHPVAVNPDPRLLRHARKRGMKVIHAHA